jgi:ABC-2 type transport system permease protein
MLWYKSWLETRWRFVIGLALLTCSAGAVVFTYPMVVQRLALATDLRGLDVGGRLGEEIREGLTLSRDYHGYIWWQWFRQNLRETWTLFAVLLGTGGLLSQASGGAALFTLSLPVSRARLLGVRAATGLAELLVLAIVPGLLVPLLSPAIGQSYGLGDALVHSLCLFLAGSVFFSLACLLSTVFSDVWRPALLSIAAFYLLSFGEQVFREFSAYGLIGAMTAQSWFRAGELPWLRLLAAGVLSASLLYAAVVNLTRRDF